MVAERRPDTPSQGAPAQGLLASRDIEKEQLALRRVAAIAAAGRSPEAVFAAVTAEVSALMDDAHLSLARYEGGGTEAVILAQTGGHVSIGTWFPGTDPVGITARMWRSHRPDRTDDFSTRIGGEPVPGVRACVAVPVFVDGTLWGLLAAASLTGPLPSTTEVRLTMFAEIVAAAVVSAAARTSARVLAQEQAALLRVAGLVAQGAGEAAIFDAVAVEAASLIDDEPTTLVRYEGKRTFTVLATRNGPARPGRRYTVPVGDAGTSAEILRTGKPARRDQYEAIKDRSYAHHDFAVGSSVTVPIFVQGRLWGALGTLNEGRRLPTETEGRLTKFSELVGSALANVQARTELERFGMEQAALRRVAELAASDVAYSLVFRAIVSEAAQLFEEATVVAGAWEPTGAWRRIQVATKPTDDTAEPRLVPREAALAQEVLIKGRPARVEDADLSTVVGVDDLPLLLGCGVPVSVAGQTWGALVAIAGQRPLPPGTEDRLTQFAQVAGTAVSSAHHRDAVSQLAREQAALRRVAELIARGAAIDEVFGAITGETSNILGDSTAGLIRIDSDGLATVVAGYRDFAPVGTRLTVDLVGVPSSKGAVHFGIWKADQASAAYNYRVGAMVAVPILVEGRFWGGLATKISEVPLSVDAENRLLEFAELAAAAVANAENKASLRASRARLVVTADETRQRLQRDVHDGAQQRLVQTVLSLKLGLDLVSRGEDPVELMREALMNAERATVELRDVVHGILPASLSRGGLRSGIESLIDRLAVPVDLDVSALPEQRLPAELEVAVYFIVAEALTNVVKHARATRTGVSVAAATAGLITIEVTDDGRGGADRRGGGLTGLADRVDAMNGTLVLISPVGVGTTVRITIPHRATGVSVWTVAPTPAEQ